MATEIRKHVATEISTATAKGAKQPRLCIVTVGDDPASAIYVKNKLSDCQRVGIWAVHLKLDESVTTQVVCDAVDQAANHFGMDAVMLQLPVPAHIDAEEVISHIPANMDVDGLTTTNMGGLLKGGSDYSSFVPCTAAGIVVLLQHYNIPIAGQHVCIIGRSNIIGKPLAVLLTALDATVTLMHSKTKDKLLLLRTADIVVTACGIPKSLRADLLKPGATVVDVSINHNEAGKLCGDIDMGFCLDEINYTPVPGGIGPMTRAALLYNVLQAWKENAHARQNRV